jgi:hypothetical protein
MRRHPNPVLVFLAAAVLTVALALGIVAVAGAYSPQQQSQQPPATPSYALSVAMPAACMGAGGLTPGPVTATCDAFGAVQFGADLSDALKKPDSMHKAVKVFAEAGTEKLVVLSFPEEMGLDPRLALVKAMMQATRDFFDYTTQRLSMEYQDRAKAEQLRTQFALADSQAVQALRDQAFAQQQSVLDAASAYLTANPGTPGFRFQCLLACQQLISAAQGFNVFDNQVPTSRTQNSPGGHGHTGLIVGGVLAGAGAVGAAAALSLRKSCGTSPGAQLNQDCFGGNSAACQQDIARMNTYCQCNGFSGFNVSTGSCQ